MLDLGKSEEETSEDDKAEEEEVTETNKIENNEEEEKSSDLPVSELEKENVNLEEGTHQISKELISKNEFLETNNEPDIKIKEVKLENKSNLDESVSSGVEPLPDVKEDQKETSVENTISVTSCKTEDVETAATLTEDNQTKEIESTSQTKPLSTTPSKEVRVKYLFRPSALGVTVLLLPLQTSCAHNCFVTSAMYWSEEAHTTRLVFDNPKPV